MGFRFRKSFGIIPGVRINLSKGGISTSLGGRGATINVGKRGVRGTVGLPGTGLSYSDMIFRRGRSAALPDEAIGQPGRQSSGFKGLLIGGVVVILAVLAFLFVAGLMSARQSGPAETTRPTVAYPAEVREEQPRSMSASSQVTTREATCRSNPTKRAKVVARLSAGQAISVEDQQAGWSRVSTEDVDCWLRSSLVR